MTAPGEPVAPPPKLAVATDAVAAALAESARGGEGVGAAPLPEGVAVPPALAVWDSVEDREGEAEAVLLPEAQGVAEAPI